MENRRHSEFALYQTAWFSLNQTNASRSKHPGKYTSVLHLIYSANLQTSFKKLMFIKRKAFIKTSRKTRSFY